MSTPTPAADVTAGTANPFDQLLDGQEAPQQPGTVTPPEPEAEAEADEPDTDDEDGADELGDAGKQALDRMKARLREERAKRREAEQKLAQQGDADEAARERRLVEEAAVKKANGRIVRAEIRAAAASKLADPSDALNFIDPDQFEVDDDGNVDQDEIAEAVTALLARKPYLAAQGGNPGPKPDRSQGAGDGKGSATTAQRFAADLSRAGF